MQNERSYFGRIIEWQIKIALNRNKCEGQFSFFKKEKQKR